MIIRGRGWGSIACYIHDRTMSKYEPSPRSSTFTAPVDGKLYLYGGKTDDFDERKKRPESNIEIFDPKLETWRHVTTKGHPPPLLYNGACASFGHHLYIHGGLDRSSYHNSLYQLDTRTLTWTDLSSSDILGGPPRKKTGCKIVCYGQKLVLFGGRCDTTGPTQPGAGYVSDEFGLMYTNELHTFDLNEGEGVLIRVVTITTTSSHLPLSWYMYSYTHQEHYKKKKTMSQ